MFSTRNQIGLNATFCFYLRILAYIQTLILDLFQKEFHPNQRTYPWQLHFELIGMMILQLFQSETFCTSAFTKQYAKKRMTCRFHKPFCNQALLCAYKPWAKLEWTRLRSLSKILILGIPKITISREGFKKVENSTQQFFGIFSREKQEQG